jgi:hypothetical protein
VAELADAGDLKSLGLERAREGSRPSGPIIQASLGALAEQTKTPGNASCRGSR